MPSTNDQILYGQSELLSVVAAQQLNESTIRLYSHQPRASSDETAGRAPVTFSDAEFFPFFFLSSSALIETYPKRFWIKELAGSGYYRYLVAFPRWNDLWDALRHVLSTYNKTALKKAAHYSELEQILFKPDAVTQFLIQAGVTLFKGLEFSDLHRVQISIRTQSRGGKKSDPRKTDDRILALALTDGDGPEEILDGRKLHETEILRRFAGIIAEWDPDVIEGHDLFESVLPYLVRRAELLTVDLALGRDGSGVKSFSPRGNPLEPDLENAIFEIAGRHLVDTRALAHGYNISKRALEHYGLRYLSHYFGSTARPIPPVPQERLAAVWRDQPQLILQQAREDCEDVRTISDHLGASYFFQCRIVPLSLEPIIRAGSASKIELMMLREYVRQKHAVPRAGSGEQKVGGYTDIFVTGIVENVLHADIESLYPSIMLSQIIRPGSDELDVFQHLLGALTSARLKAKHLMQNSESPKAMQLNDVLQSSLKILINSFYGYLGYPRGLFNDFGQADRVTASGQEILRTIIREVELRNGRVIEADTDGLYFVAPDNVRGEEQESIFVAKISSALPQGIHLVLAGRYKKMLSYRKKNYALLGYDDRLIVRGSSLISRAMEKYARTYVRLCIELLLRSDIKAIHELYVSMAQDIGQHRWDVEDFCRTESLRDTLETYDLDVREQRRKPAAAYEVAKHAGSTFRPGDRVAYYVTGQTAGVKIVENCRLASEWDPNFPDENSAYYLERLNECSRKFEFVFSQEDFNRIFSAEDLFGFSPDGIRIARPNEPSTKETSQADDDASEYGIWLDQAS